MKLKRAENAFHFSLLVFNTLQYNHTQFLTAEHAESYMDKN